MKILYIILASTLIISQGLNAQCTVDLGIDITINCGESVDLSAMGAGSVPVLTTDFDNGQAE